MNKIIFLVALAVILAAVFGFVYNKKKQLPVETKVMILKKDDNGREIKLRKGDTIQIELEELGSAGYTWQIDNLDETHLKLLSEETKPTRSELIGAPVIGVWKMETIQKGSSEIKMDYFRPWEGKDSAIDHFLVNIRIKT